MSHHYPTDPAKGPNQTATLVAGMVALVLAVGAYIACELAGVDSAPVIALVGPVVAALLLRDGIQRVEAKADQAVRNTNGALTGGIEEAMRRIYREEAAKAVVPVQAPDGSVTVELVATPPSAPSSSTV